MNHKWYNRKQNVRCITARLFLHHIDEHQTEILLVPIQPLSAEKFDFLRKTERKRMDNVNHWFIKYLEYKKQKPVDSIREFFTISEKIYYKKLPPALNLWENIYLTNYIFFILTMVQYIQILYKDEGNDPCYHIESFLVSTKPTRVAVEVICPTAL